MLVMHHSKTFWNAQDSRLRLCHQWSNSPNAVHCTHRYGLIRTQATTIHWAYKPECWIQLPLQGLNRSRGDATIPTTLPLSGAHVACMAAWIQCIDI